MKRPWGNYLVLHKERGIQVKRVELKPGARLSLQKHLKRTEQWIIVKGTGRAIINARVSRVREGSYIQVARGALHRIHNTGKKPLVFIEVQFGKYLGEDDIVRFADDYGRV